MTKFLVAEKDNTSGIDGGKKKQKTNVKMHFNQILMFWYIDKSPRYLKMKQNRINPCIIFQIGEGIISFKHVRLYIWRD